MNPAVAFKPVADAAHSVVLTSGTLAPLEGFASEVGALESGLGAELGWGLAARRLQTWRPGSTFP